MEPHKRRDIKGTCYSILIYSLYILIYVMMCGCIYTRIYRTKVRVIFMLYIYILIVLTFSTLCANENIRRLVLVIHDTLA